VVAHPTPALHLRLPANPAAVAQAREAVLAHLADLPLTASVLYSLDVVLEELIMNISLHAFDGAADRQFDLKVTAHARGVTLQFVDAGHAFDPTAAAAPAPAASLDAATPGGLGLRLLRQRCSRMRYERDEGMNRLTVELALA
jgi:anti-sigma regulatory factor (Ser/Thr protein kinase)